MNYSSYGFGVGQNRMMFMTLGDIVEGYSGGVHAPVVKKIEFARPKIFDFDYPTLDAAQKEVFEQLFIENFYFSEIAFETEGRFKFRLQHWLKKNMPYWNKLIESQKWESQIKNPFHNYELTDTTSSNLEKNGETGTTVDRNTSEDNRQKVDKLTSQQESSTDNLVNNEINSNNSSTNANETNETIVDMDGNVSTTTNNTNFNRDLKEDTPQNRLTITADDGEGLIEYASSIEENKATGNETVSGTSGELSQTNEEKTIVTDVLGGSTSDLTSNKNSELNAQGNEQTDVHEDKTGNENIKQNVVDSESQKEIVERFAVGSIGVARYDELLNGYRTIFKNYTEEIFDAMHLDLFMLVY